MLQNIPKEKILEVLREGPTVPSKIVKRVGGDTMLIGAILSTLIKSGDVAISSLKIGGSPLYFIPGEEEKLEQFIDHLNEKDRKVFNLLKEKKIMQDSKEDPLTRVSLRSMRDFAKQFEVDSFGKKELFWRFYLSDRDEALLQAKTLLDVVSQEKTNLVRTDDHTSAPVKTTETMIYNKGISSEEVASQDEASQILIEPSVIHEKVHKPHQEKMSGNKKEDFFEKVKLHVHALNLDMISKEKIKKSEYTLILKNHDTNEYSYCVAKDKKTVNEGDLSTAFVFAHSKKMPCLFLMTGNLTKKAEAMLHKEFKDMKIEKI